jgi:hypothetical protein
MSNLEARKICITKMVGKQVIVTKLGSAHPEDVKGDFLYVPLPEYGVALWLDRLDNPNLCDILSV